MDGWLRQSTAVTVPIGPFVDSTDGDAEEAALTIAQADVRLSKNGGASAQKNNATSATHDADGVYLCPFSTTDTNTLGQLVAWVHVSGALFAKHIFHVIPAQVWDSFFGSDTLDVSVIQWLGTAVATPSVAGRPSVDAIALSGDTAAADNAKSFFDGTGYAGTNNVIPTVTTLTGHTAQTGDAFARLGAPAGASVSADVAAVKTDTGNLVTRITSGLFTGITSLAQWLGLIAGKQVGNTTARTELRATGAGSGTFDETTDSQEALKDDQMTAVELENAVLDAVLADHLDSGSVGAGINAASSAGDPWATAIPGAYGAGTAGKIVGDNLNATVSSRSSLDAAGIRTALGMGSANLDTQLSGLDTKLNTIDDFLDTEIAGMVTSLATIAGYLDTEIAAILADTNELQTDWVNGGRLDLLIDGITTLATAIKATTDLLPDSGALSSLATAALFNATTRTDPSALAGALASGLTPLAKLDWILARVMRESTFNKTTGEEIVKNAAGTNIGKATAADDGTTTTRGAFGAP